MPKKAVFFLPDGLLVTVAPGETLLQAAAKAGITLRGACGGKGVCGRCRVQVESGRVSLTGRGKIPPEEIAAGRVLACLAVPEDDVTVRIPVESRLTEHRVLLAARDSGVLASVPEEEAVASPLFVFKTVSLTPPSLSDNTDDFGRLCWSLEREGEKAPFFIDYTLLRGLPRLLREAGWQVNVALGVVEGGTEIQGVGPATDRKTGPFGLAVDVGTTTVAVELVNLATGSVIGTAGTYNRQAAFGDDVISRIIYATEVAGGQSALQEAVKETINSLVAEVLEVNNLGPADIRAVVCAGNTTMIHLLLGLDPTHIRLEPYIPVANMPPPVRAAELGLAVHPKAWVYFIPGVASYVGGDITAGIKVSGIGAAEPLTLFLDIGTNGEIVLGNREWLMACACSAGPAFEGSGIACGMRAMPGAIEAVRVLPGGFEVVYRTVGEEKPLGICGSGLIDLLASLHEAGVIDRSGRFISGLDSPRVRQTSEGPEFVVAWENETGTGKEIVVTQADIQNLLRAKAAVFAGIRTLLANVGLPVEMVERVFIAGGFGRFLNVRDAIKIGMLPDLPLERYTYIGNSSLRGARLALLSRRVLREMKEIARRVTYVELSVGNRFMEEFMSALFLPHTDLSLFPSLGKEHS